MPRRMLLRKSTAGAQSPVGLGLSSEEDESTHRPVSDKRTAMRISRPGVGRG